MVLSNEDEGSSSTLSKHSELCDKLKLEARIGNEAWESFQALNKNFTLEVGFTQFDAVFEKLKI